MAERNISSDTTKAGPMTGWDPALLVGFNQQALDYWTRSLAVFSAEMGQFMQARMQEDLGAWTKLASCKDASQAFEYQRQFMQKAASDYLNEMSKIARLTVNMANDSFAAARGAARQTQKAA